MAFAQSALNCGSSFSSTIGLMDMDNLAGVLPLMSALLRAARCALALSRTSVSSKYWDLWWLKGCELNKNRL